MTDALDTDLQDDDLIGEIRLAAELMVAAAQSPTALSQAAIDAILDGCPAPG